MHFTITVDVCDGSLGDSHITLACDNESVSINEYRQILFFLECYEKFITNLKDGLKND